MKNLVIVGINHKTAPVEVREKFSFAIHEVVRANTTLLKDTGLHEGMILSTCNRVEIYAVVNGYDKDYTNRIKSFISKFHNINTLDFEDRIYIYHDQEAVKHLFKVAAGLDSMVIGEVEILGQVKRAYYDARISKTTGKVLNRLLQKAFNTAKKIRTDTVITRGSVSVSSVAVRLANKILGKLHDKKVLIIGAGKIGEQLVLYFKKNGIKSIFVTNRTYEKTKVLTDKFAATALEFEDLRDSLKDIDIVISSTSAPYCIIGKADMVRLMPKRKQRPIFIIDLAVPRDIEPDVNRIDNVYLYDIDDLKMITDENIALRKSELDSCNRIIHESCRRFNDWLIAEKIQNAE